MKTKRMYAWVMALALCFATLFGNSLDSRASDATATDAETESEEEEEGNANSWRYINGAVISDAETGQAADSFTMYGAAVAGGSTATGFIASATSGVKGIDVSSYNGTIDWAKVKASGVQFAIIRCGYGQDLAKQDDTAWEYNVSECERLDIPYGVYIYSYANTVQKASSEADHVLRLLEGHTPTLPVYYDMEDNSTLVYKDEDGNTQSYTSATERNAALALFAETFCNKVSAAGYKVGIYANLNWWTHYLTDSTFNNEDWSKWVAQYRYTDDGSDFKCTYSGAYDMWQFTSTGQVEGITGNVDLDYWVSNESIILPKISYSTHVQSYGWQSAVYDGTSSGTTGQSKRLEAIKINNETGLSGNIEYQVHCQTYGWMSWVKNGAVAGVTGQSKRLEAIRIRLTGELAEKYDVYYRVHAQSYGWLDWAKNGQAAGTATYSKRLEAIQIVLVEKGGTAPGSTTKPYVSPNVSYKTHVQTYGWQSAVYDGASSGTTGQSKRLESISITNLADVSGSIRYSVHCQSYGWMDWVSDGAVAGTTGQGKRLEAIKIELTGELAQKYDVYYRVHAQSYGWLDWAKNGEPAGTEGLSKRLEAIQIVYVPKGSAAPGATTRPYVKK